MALRTLSIVAALLACVSVDAAPANAQIDTITINPRVYHVGRWADGIVFAGNSLWISESGQRTIAQLDTDNRVARRITVGRLPTKMAFANDGAVYTIVETDNLVWQQFPNQQRGRAIGDLNGCPTGISAGDQNVWILSQCSGRTHVIRLDPRNGNHTPSRMLTGGGVDILAHRGQVWVAHFEKGNALSVINEQTLAVRTPAIQGSFRALTGSGNIVYAAGQVRDGGQEVVMAINPSTLQETRRQLVDQRVLLMADDDRHVVAVGQNGKIWVYAANTLELLRVINLRVGNFDTRSILLIGDDIYLTNNQQQGSSTGAILVLTNWRPTHTVGAPALPARQLPQQAAPNVQPQLMPSQMPQAAPNPMPPAVQPGPAPGGALPSAGTECPYQVANVPPDNVVWLYEDPDTSARRIVAVPPDARGLVADRCLRDWCHVAFRGANGWVARSNIRPTCN